MATPTRRRFRIRHLILAVLCLMYFVAYVDRVNISVAAPAIRRELGLTPLELGFIFSAFAYPYAFMQIAGGWGADRFGPRRVLIVLSVLWAAGTVLTGASWSVASFVAFRVLVGVGEGGAFPAATRAFTWWLPVRERGFAQGITHSFARLGGAVTPPLVLAITTRGGWRASFTALGAASLAWTALWMATFRDAPEAHPWVTREELAEIRSGGEPSPDRRGPTPWRQIARRMWLVTVVDFCYGWSLWVFLTWLPSYLSEARGFALDRLAIMTALPLVAGVAGDTIGGVISDAILVRTGDLRLARRALLAGGLGGAFAWILPAVATGSATSAVYFLTAAFFCLELTNAVLWTLPLDIAGAHAGTAGGMMNTGFGVAGMISPVVFGVLIQRTGRYELPMLLSAGLLLIGAIGSLRIDPTMKVNPAGPADEKARI
ncbi:MAG TPA: MFS transporter [Vicinamibacterales bacterium]|nr:MFS transporter [Vicinamibacterales bacterium]